ncbi:hypothetical protein FPQ18DRAFT_416558 [Pyronema domesticum]|nr:hypothetical protein FPQ18DRAFT_416558 [Pyronema domesticum]
MSPNSMPDTPPKMTQDEIPSSETSLGPTGSETEEFYAYQRSNPGLEKTEYLEWFQSRFHKEIELRRRRLDQPSDLEFMVIKKRSKYRDRIGEESTELCRHSELHPQKTYRELAEWFQDRFGKEIDITAISRALKRSRQSEANEAYFHQEYPDQTPPAAKRGRRSLGNYIAVPASAPPVQHSIAVDTPSKESTSWEQSPASRSAQSDVKREKHDNQPTSQHLLRPIRPHQQQQPHQQHRDDQNNAPPQQYLRSQGPASPQFPLPSISQIQSQPTANVSVRGAPSVLQGSEWVSPNSATPGTSKDIHVPQMERIATLQQHCSTVTPPSANHINASVQHLNSRQPSPHASPENPQGHHPSQPRTNNPIPIGLQSTSTCSLVSQLSSSAPRYLDTAQRQAHFNNAMQQHMRGLEGISGLYAQMEGLVNDKTEAYNILQEEHAKLLSEHTKVLDERDRLRTWGMDLQQGNLELQEFERKSNEFERKYYEARHQLSQAQKENRDLRQNDRGAIEDRQKKLAQRDRQITSTSQLLDNNSTDYSGNAQDTQQGSLKINKGLDKWVGRLLEENLRHDKQLKILVQALESAGVKDWSERIHEIKTYVCGMEESRRAKESEWKEFMDTGSIRISPVPGSANEDEGDSGRSDHVQLLLNPEKGT